MRGTYPSLVKSRQQWWWAGGGVSYHERAARTLKVFGLRFRRRIGMKQALCQGCNERPGVAISVEAIRGNAHRVWLVRVCRDCWRAFEALLDGAMLARQPGLLEDGTKRSTWFL